MLISLFPLILTEPVYHPELNPTEIDIHFSNDIGYFMGLAISYSKIFF
jgi:hypothetical protein